MSGNREFWAIDFDRCVGNAGAAVRLLERIVGEVAPEVDTRALESARSNLELAGGSFDMLAYIHDTVQNEATYQRVVERYRAEGLHMGNGLLQPGTHELLRYLDELSIPYGIVSYGHVAWQELKIIAAGLGDVPRYIVSSSRKGEIIASWQSDDASFQIPTELTARETHVDHVVLVDDKAVSFTGLPQNARGYWVRGEELLASQQGEIPSAVREVRSLGEVVDLEKARRGDY